jgi:hypothetical protein
MGRAGRKRALTYSTSDEVAATMFRRHRQLSRVDSSMPTEVSPASVPNTPRKGVAPPACARTWNAKTDALWSDLTLSECLI